MDAAALEFVGYAFRRGERDLQLSSKLLDRLSALSGTRRLSGIPGVAGRGEEQMCRAR